MRKHKLQGNHSFVVVFKDLLMLVISTSHDDLFDARCLIYLFHFQRQGNYVTQCMEPALTQHTYKKYLWLFFIKNFSVGANELRSPNLFCVLSLCCVICQEYRIAFPNPVRHIHIISISISWIKRKHCCLEHRMTRPSPVLLSPRLLCCLPTFKLISDQR